MKTLILLAAVAALALPAAALGTTPSQAASASCKAQLKAVGAASFDGPSGLYASFGACVSKAQHQTPQQRQNLLSAEKQCKSQLTSMGESAFDAKYGTNAKNGKHASAPTSGTASNAFGKCVAAVNAATSH
jgi:hypothetical protein